MVLPWPHLRALWAGPHCRPGSPQCEVSYSTAEARPARLILDGGVPPAVGHTRMRRPPRWLRRWRKDYGGRTAGGRRRRRLLGRLSGRNTDSSNATYTASAWRWRGLRWADLCHAGTASESRRRRQGGTGGRHQDACLEAAVQGEAHCRLCKETHTARLARGGCRRSVLMESSASAMLDTLFTD